MPLISCEKPKLSSVWLILAGFGSFLTRFGWFLARFGWFWLVLARSGSFAYLVVTQNNKSVNLKNTIPITAQSN